MERYTADYIISLGDQPSHEFDPGLVEYGEVAADSARAVIDLAKLNGIDGEVYCVRRQEYREICPGYGVYDWFNVADVDQFTLYEDESNYIKD